MPRRRAVPVALVALVALALLPAPAAPATGAPAAGRYANPVSRGFADTFADPMVIRGQDGLWYAYGTSDPLREGERTPHRLPMARSVDLVSWTYAGDAFSGAGLPPYAAPGAALWAPDVRYLDGRYVMYFTVTDTTVSPEGGDFAIGAATAPTPTGPWTPAAAPVVPPRPGGGGGWWWTIDPAQFTDVDGTKYLYYGSYYGGIWVSELSADGLRAVGTPTMVAIDNRFEGSYVVRRGGYYYLFASSANCCAGPTTGYSVSVGRATGPRGPFLDRDGLRLDASRAGGTPVVAQNGNRWIGAGHNGLVTDLAGQDWLVYHAIDRADPYLDEPFGINERPMLLDRLDWIAGWPTVRAGAGPSDRPQSAPVTRGPIVDTFAGSRLDRRWRAVQGRWAVTDGHLRGTGVIAARSGVPSDVRVETDLRLPSGGSAGLRVAGVTVRVSLPAGQLRVENVAGTVVATAALPAGFRADTWHNLAVELRGDRVRARLSPARLGDQLAEVAARTAVRRTGITLIASGTADFDNVTAAPLYRPVRRPVPTPAAGRPLPAYSDEFDAAPGPAWTWVRPDPAVTVSGGSLRWPLRGTDLAGAGNDAGVLLRRAAPAGDYLAETRVTLDLGEDTVRNYQQAGLVAYVDDDRFARLAQVAIWNTRQVEYGYEIPYAGGLSYGGSIVGAPATTTWLRLAHRVDPVTGEHEFRAGLSRDGAAWTWGAVWTFPAGTAPRIGLVAHGGAEPPAVAAFDYLRFYRTIAS